MHRLRLNIKYFVQNKCSLNNKTTCWWQSWEKKSLLVTFVMCYVEVVRNMTNLISHYIFCHGSTKTQRTKKLNLVIQVPTSEHGVPYLSLDSLKITKRGHGTKSWIDSIYWDLKAPLRQKLAVLVRLFFSLIILLGLSYSRREGRGCLGVFPFCLTRGQV